MQEDLKISGLPLHPTREANNTDFSLFKTVFATVQTKQNIC